MSAEFYLKKFKKGVIVAPEKEHIEKLTNALYFLSERDPEMFGKFRSMKAILVYPGKGYEKEYGLHSEDRIWVCDPKIVMRSSVVYLASLLVHESWHLVQYDRGLKNFGDSAEQEAYQKQKDFLIKLGDKELAEWLGEGFKKKWWVYKTPEGKETLYFPSSKPLKKFIDDYKNGKLKIKEVLFDDPTLDGDDS